MSLLRTTAFLVCSAIALSSLAACNVAGFEWNGDKKSSKKSSTDDDDRPKKKSKKKDEKDAKDADANKKAEEKVPPKSRSRVAELFGVEGASTELVPIAMGVDGVQLHRAKSWHSEPYPDFASAQNSQFPKELRALCHLTSRIQPGNVMSGIKLWARSAGGAPKAWSGPETVKLGPDAMSFDLYWGKDGVELGGAGGSSPGMTVALYTKELPELLLIGVAREDAPAEMKRELVACLESFAKKK